MNSRVPARQDCPLQYIEANRLEAGNVWINSYFNLSSGSPFGGFKESGIGSEFCRETLNMYTHLKAITYQAEVNPAWYAPKNQ